MLEDILILILIFALGMSSGGLFTYRLYLAAKRTEKRVKKMISDFVDGNDPE